MEFIGKLLPIHGYIVSMQEPLHHGYERSLTHLYQPLIGIEAVSLFQTLLHEIPIQQGEEKQTHHTLMNYMNLPLDKIYQARKRLEGIGLLKTYKQKIEQTTSFIYELHCPFIPEQFFSDGMLSELLYHHIGEAKYNLLKNHFITQNVVEGKNVTASFHEVFELVKPSKEQMEPIEEQLKKDHQLVDNIDFSWLETSLKQRMIPVHKVLTTDNKKLISELTFLYELPSHEIEKSILWALTDENKLDIEEFRAACHYNFKTSNNHKRIDLVEKQQKPLKQQRQEIQKQQSKEEQLIQQFETISPKQLLEDLSSGRQASDRELNMISDIMTKQGLPVPVMNVLIHYVLIQSNMKLSKPYLDTIASHWSRAQLKTAREAMLFAKKEIKQFQENKAKRKRPYQKTSKEIVPDWFLKRDQEQSKPQEPKKQAKNYSKEEDERKKLEALINQFANKE